MVDIILMVMVLGHGEDHRRCGWMALAGINLSLVSILLTVDLLFSPRPGGRIIQAVEIGLNEGIRPRLTLLLLLLLLLLGLSGLLALLLLLHLLLALLMISAVPMMVPTATTVGSGPTVHLVVMVMAMVVIVMGMGMLMDDDGGADGGCDGDCDVDSDHGGGGL